MKNLFAYLVVCVALVVLAGCIGSGNSTLSTVAVTTPQTYPGNLNGQIFDAVTGAPISGVGLTVDLVQGASIRTPDTLVTSSSDPAAGTYAFANIPVEAAAVNTYKLIVSKPGYQHFESEFTLGATLGANSTLSGYAPFFSKIGDVYLYPIGVSASPVVINVKDSIGKTVAGATVELLQYISANNPVIGANAASSAAATANLSPNILAPTNGLTSGLVTAVTDATGVATFPASSVALGAEYIPVVLGTTANGFNLATKFGTAIIAGNVTQNQTLSMTNLSSLTLAEVSRSFTVNTTAPLVSGILNVIFNQPFTLDTTSTWTAALYVTPAGVASAVNAASATATATATVTGSSLVISPTITGLANLPASGVYITYTYPGAVYTTLTGQYSNSIFNASAPGAAPALATATSTFAGLTTNGGVVQLK